MDLGNFAIDDQTIGTMVVKNPVTGADFIDDESGEPVTIDLRSKDSPASRARQRQRLDDAMRRAKKNRSGNAFEDISAADLEQQSIEDLAHSMIGWKHFGLPGEEKTEFTPANAKKALTIFVWLRRQVDEYLEQTANFIKAS